MRGYGGNSAKILHRNQKCWLISGHCLHQVSLWPSSSLAPCCLVTPRDFYLLASLSWLRDLSLTAGVPIPNWSTSFIFFLLPYRFLRTQLFVCPDYETCPVSVLTARPFSHCWSPHSKLTSFILFCSLTSSLEGSHGHSYLCGLCAEIDNGRSLRQSDTASKMPKIILMATHNTEIHTHIHIYICIYIYIYIYIYIVTTGIIQ